jgi:hypothetical protein
MPSFAKNIELCHNFCQNYGVMPSFAKNIKLCHSLAEFKKLCRVLPKLWKYVKFCQKYRVVS